MALYSNKAGTINVITEPNFYESGGRYGDPVADWPLYQSRRMDEAWDREGPYAKPIDWTEEYAKDKPESPSQE